MTVMRFLSVLLVVVLLATAAQPARAEAFDPQWIGLMAGAAVAAVLLVGVLVIGNGRDAQGGDDAALRRWYEQGGDDSVMVTANNAVQPVEPIEALDSGVPVPAPQTP
jgi:hypothetical protein